MLNKHENNMHGLRQPVATLDPALRLLGLSGVSSGPRAQWVRVPNATLRLPVRPTCPNESRREWDTFVAAVIGMYRAFPTFPASRGSFEKIPLEHF